jgi:SulP family sulfate permease
VLLLIMLVAAPLAAYIPLAALAAILLVVAYKMGEWREIAVIKNLAKADVIVWAVTFMLTVLADLTIAVQVGMLLAAMLYIHRVSQTTQVTAVTDESEQLEDHHVVHSAEIPDYVSLLSIDGPFLFGTTDKLAETMREDNQLHPIVILRLNHMNAIDATGVHAIEALSKQLTTFGRVLLLCGATGQPKTMILQSVLVEVLEPRVATSYAITTPLSTHPQIANPIWLMLITD